jgi:hypothetical protein
MLAMATIRALTRRILILYGSPDKQQRLG